MINAEKIVTYCQGIKYHFPIYNNMKDRCRGSVKFIKGLYPFIATNQEYSSSRKKAEFRKKLKAYTNFPDHLVHESRFLVNDFPMDIAYNGSEVMYMDGYDLRTKISKEDYSDEDFSAKYDDFLSQLKDIELIPRTGNYVFLAVRESALEFSYNRWGWAWNLNKITKTRSPETVFNKEHYFRNFADQLHPKIKSGCATFGSYLAQIENSNATDGSPPHDYDDYSGYSSGDYDTDVENNRALSCDDPESDFDCDTEGYISILKKGFEKGLLYTFAMGQYDLVVPYIAQKKLTQKLQDEIRPDSTEPFNRGAHDFDVNLYPGGHSILPLKGKQLKKFENDLLCSIGIIEKCTSSSNDQQ